MSSSITPTDPDLVARPVALVTGASRGIGRATVLRLVDEGYDVAFCYAKDADAATSLSKDAADRGGRAIGSQVDVASATLVEQWVTEVERDLGPIVFVVANAGVVRDKPALLMSAADWHDVVDINLSGAFHTCRATAFHMVKRRRGSIVTVSSIAGIYGHAGQSNYAASKAGLVGMTKSMAKEFGRFGVRANVVAPGFIETDMVADLRDKVRAEAERAVPLRTFGTPDDVADAIVYLATARYVTGAVVQVDGGLMI